MIIKLLWSSGYLHPQPRVLMWKQVILTSQHSAVPLRHPLNNSISVIATDWIVLYCWILDSEPPTRASVSVFHSVSSETRLSSHYVLCGDTREEGLSGFWFVGVGTKRRCQRAWCRYEPGVLVGCGETPIVAALTWGFYFTTCGAVLWVSFRIFGDCIIGLLFSGWIHGFQSRINYFSRCQMDYNVHGHSWFPEDDP